MKQLNLFSEKEFHGTPVEARGGNRKGAGRPKGTGEYGEPTVPIRVPVSALKQILRFLAIRKKVRNLGKPQSLIRFNG